MMRTVRFVVTFVFVFLQCAAVGCANKTLRGFFAESRRSGGADSSRGGDAGGPADGRGAGAAADGPPAVDEALQRAGAERGVD